LNHNDRRAGGDYEKVIITGNQPWKPTDGMRRYVRFVQNLLQLGKDRTYCRRGIMGKVLMRMNRYILLKP
jgi:hypothetical protein